MDTFQNAVRKSAEGAGKHMTIFSAFSDDSDSARAVGTNAVEKLKVAARKMSRNFIGTRQPSYTGDEEAGMGNDSAFGADFSNDRSLWYEGQVLIFNPKNYFYMLWWQLSVLLTYWNLFQVPFSCAYYGSRPRTIDTVVWVVDFFFLMDVLVSFCTPITVNGHVITNRSAIATRYISFHFWVDLSAAIPFDRIGELAAPGNPYVSLLAFTRVLRIRRLFMLQDKLEKTISINYEGVVICKLLTMVGVLAHMEACLFWFIGAVQEPNGWMYEMGVIDDMVDQPWRQYLISLYWAITTFTTVGYGDLHPVNEAEQTFAIFVMVVNMGMTAYVIGNITLLTTKVDQNILNFRAKVSEVNSYLLYKDIPSDLRNIAIQQLETNQELSEQTDKALDHTPSYIRNRILSHLYYGKLRRTAILRGTSEEFVNNITHAATLHFFQPDTLVMRAGERTYNWYIVMSGMLHVEDSRRNTVRSITKGGTFGDKGVLCNMRESYNVRSKAMCRLLVVPYAEFKSICVQNQPDYRQACKNLIIKLDHYTPHNEQDAQDIRDTIQRVRSHIISLKTDLVTKLCSAAATGDIVGIRSLLQSDQEHNINDGDYDGRRPLHVAAASGHIPLIKYLITEEGAQVNVKDNFGCVPLFDAVSNNHAAAGEVLRSYGAQLMLRDTGCTLCNLVLEGSFETLKLYLENGANPNCGDYDMRTPLHIACAEGLLPIVKLLLQFRANPHIRDRFGTTPLDEARKLSNNVAIAEFMDGHQAAVDDFGRDVSTANNSHEIFQTVFNASPAVDDLIGTVPANGLPPRQNTHTNHSNNYSTNNALVRARHAAGIATPPHMEDLTVSPGVSETPSARCSDGSTMELDRGAHSLFSHGFLSSHGPSRAGHHPSEHPAVRRHTPEREHRLSPLAASSAYPDVHRVRDTATGVRHSAKYSQPSNNSDIVKRFRPPSRDSADLGGGSWLMGMDRDHGGDGLMYDGANSSHFSNNGGVLRSHAHDEVGRDGNRVTGLSPLHLESHAHASGGSYEVLGEQPEQLRSSYYGDEQNESRAPTTSARNSCHGAEYVQLVDGLAEMPPLPNSLPDSSTGEGSS